MGKDIIRTKRNAAYKNWLFTCVAVFAVAYSVNCFVIPSIIYELDSNVLYSDTPIPILLDYLNRSIELLAISFSYAVMLCLIFCSGVKAARPVLSVFTAAAVYKYLANTVMSWIDAGSIPSSFAWDIVNILFFATLEFLQILVIYYITKGIICRYTDMLAIKKKSGIEVECVYPFKRLYDKGNCLLHSALICAVTTFAVKLGGVLLSDIWSIIAYGFPNEAVTWLLMLVSYASMTLFGAVVYIAVYFGMSLLMKPVDAFKAELQ